MRILLIFPQIDRRTGLYIYRAMCQLGHDVVISDPNVDDGKLIISKLVACEPDLTFCSRSPQLVSIAKELRRYSRKLTCWNTDARYDVLEWSWLFPLIAECDVYFTVGSPNQYWKIGFSNAAWCPQGIDPDFHKPIVPTAEQMEKYGCDLLFVGTFGRAWDGRQEFLTSLLAQHKYSVKIFGENSPMGLPFLSDERANIAYSCAKINIGFNGWPKIPWYTSVRDWKLLASGRPVMLTECIDAKTLYKELYNKITFYSNIADFWNRIDDLFQKNLDFVDDKNYIILTEKHSYKNRIQRILEVLYA